MVEPNDGDMRAAASMFRAEARAKELKERKDEPEERDTDMSVSEALEQMSITFESDKFFAPLAEPLFACRNLLVEGAGKAKKNAAAELGTLVEQINNLKELNLFESEQQVLMTIIKGLLDEAGDPLTLSTVLPGVRSTKSAMSGQPKSEEEIKKIKAAMERIEKMKKKAPAPTAEDIADSMKKEREKQAAKSQDPWEFKEFKNEPEFNVTIKVPAATKTSDCKVKFQASTLQVSVKGHACQPYVINGEMMERVDPEACSWTLDGSGDGRKLCLEMEKKMGGFMWNRLMKPVDVFA